MRTRFKTFSEFMKGILVVHQEGGVGVKIICRLAPQVLRDYPVKPWNTPATKRFHLALLYFEAVLIPRRLSDKVPRVAGFEWLGRRVVWREAVHVVCDAWQCAHQQTGEVQMCLSIFPVDKGSVLIRSHPIEVMESQIKII